MPEEELTDQRAAGVTEPVGYCEYRSLAFNVLFQSGSATAHYGRNAPSREHRSARPVSSPLACRPVDGPAPPPQEDNYIPGWQGHPHFLQAPPTPPVHSVPRPPTPTWFSDHPVARVFRLPTAGLLRAWRPQTAQRRSAGQAHPEGRSVPPGRV